MSTQEIAGSAIRYTTMEHTSHLWSGMSAWCGSGDPTAVLSIAGALFLGALFGSVAHCGPMCAPFVVMQLAGGQAALHRLSGALPLYHLGRLTTYAALGTVAGALGASATRLGEVRWALGVLLGLAALSFLFQASRGLGPWLPRTRLHAWAQSWGGGVAWLATRLVRGGIGSGLSRYRLGLVLGLLPCGFLYAALIAASATGSVWGGGFAMAAFALGTMPGLIMLGLLGG